MMHAEGKARLADSTQQLRSSVRPEASSPPRGARPPLASGSRKPLLMSPQRPLIVTQRDNAQIPAPAV